MPCHIPLDGRCSEVGDGLATVVLQRVASESGRRGSATKLSTHMGPPSNDSPAPRSERQACRSSVDSAHADTEVDFEQLSRQLLRALRGKSSQRSFSKRLGFSTNVAHTWETGSRVPTASNFLRVAEKVGHDVGERLARFSRNAALADGAEPSPRLVGRFLNDLRGRTSVTDLAAACGVTRFTLARWLSGKSEPRLPDFIRVVEAASLRVLDFVSLWADPQKLDAISELWRAHQAQRALAYSLPWSHAVMRSLELTSYAELERHEPGWIAARLGIPAAEEERCLQALHAAGNIAMQDSHWVQRRVLSIDTSQDAELGLRLRRWWSEVGLERMGSGREGFFAHNLFTVSNKDADRIRKLFLECFRALRGIVAQSQPPEQLLVANVQLFPLHDVPDAGSTDVSARR